MIGVNSGNKLTSGSFNTLVGFNSSPAMTTATNNVSVGGGVATLITTGSNNTVVKRNAGNAIITTSGNTIMGCYSASTVGISNGCYFGASITSTANATNEIVVGTSITGAGSNTATIGNASTTNTYLKGTVNCSTLACTSLNCNARSIIASSAYTGNISTTLVKYIPSTSNGSQYYISDVSGTSFILLTTAPTGTVVTIRRAYTGSVTLPITSANGLNIYTFDSNVATDNYFLPTVTGNNTATFIFYRNGWYQI